MMFALMAALWAGTCYLAYKIGFKSAVDASASLCIKLLMIIEEQAKELETQKTPQDG